MKNSRDTEVTCPAATLRAIGYSRAIALDGGHQRWREAETTDNGNRMTRFPSCLTLDAPSPGLRRYAANPGYLISVSVKALFNGSR